MPEAMYTEWQTSLEAAGWMTAEELAQYHTEYEQWLDRTREDLDDTLVFWDQMA